jgi:hypothetical protein
MTESESQVASTSQVVSAPTGTYNFNLTVSGALQLTGQATDSIQEVETVDETTQTTQGPGASVSDVDSTSQVVSAPAGTYNFNLTVSGELQLTGQETETIQEDETVDETTQTSGDTTPTPTPTPTP